MNKNIKYIIEKIQKFNPIDYNDDDIIDKDTISEITDPINSFLQFLEQYVQGPTDGHIRIYGENLKKEWLEINNKIITLSNSYSDEQINADPGYIWLDNYNLGSNLYSHNLYITDSKKLNNIVFTYINNSMDEDEIVIGPSMFIRDNFEVSSPLKYGMIPKKIIDKFKSKF